MLIVLVLVGVPFVFIIYKICAGLKADEPKSRKKKSKKELEEEADDPMAWFAGKLNDMAMKREEAKVEKKQGGNVTPEQLWTMLDANKDGILSMGEFKKGVMKNESLQYLLFTGNNPDVKTMKAVFKNMHVSDTRAFALALAPARPACLAFLLPIPSTGGRTARPRPPHAERELAAMSVLRRTSTRTRLRLPRRTSWSTGTRSTRTRAGPCV
eukprot:COSAG06_NODE_2046_length_7748_cov_7.658779_7_plen_212_part_00